MAQTTSPALSPPEILRAAYQAEANGQIAYAVQFYRHLTDYFGRTPEANEALTALHRLKQAPPPSANGTGRPLSQALAANQTAGSAPAYLPPASVEPTSPSQSAQQPTMRRTRSLPSVRPTFSRRPTSRYKAGRVLSVLMIVLGWVAIAVSIVMGGVNLGLWLGAMRVADVPAALRETLPVLAGLVPAGLILLVLGQVFLAIFRTANATADIAAALHPHALDDDEDHR